jgi:phage baseplate assembly protein W
MTDFNTPHFKSPFRILGRSAEYVEQGSADELVQNCIAILRTPFGSRDDMPDFGLIQQEFEDDKNITVQDIEAALLRDEPRARSLTTEQMEEMVREVQVQLLATTADLSSERSNFVPPATPPVITIIDGGSATPGFTTTIDGGAAPPEVTTTLDGGDA